MGTTQAKFYPGLGVPARKRHMMGAALSDTVACIRNSGGIPPEGVKQGLRGG